MKTIDRMKQGPFASLFRKVPGEIWCLGAIVVLHVLLAAGIAGVLYPINDEAFYASPAANWVLHHHFGTTTFESAPGLPDLEKRTLWIVPLYPILLAGWFHTFGIGLLEQRSLSLPFSALSVFAWYWIMRKLSGDGRIALCAAALLAVDHVLLCAANGRPDIMGLGWGTLGMAGYLCFRETRLPLACFLGCSGVALAGLSHPIPGFLALANVTILAANLDLRRLGWRPLVAGAAPFLAGGLALALYIHPDWTTFRAQFSWGMAFSGRLSGSTDPLGALWRVAGFQLANFQPTVGSGPWAWFKMIIPVTYLVTLGIAIVSPRIRRAPGLIPLFAVIAADFAILPFLASYYKWQYYVHTLTLLPPLVAVVWLTMLRNRIGGRLVFTFLILLTVTTQLARIAHSLQRNSLASNYEPLAARLRAAPFDKGFFWGDASWAYATGLDRLVEDPHFGLYSGKRPDFIILDGPPESLRIPGPDGEAHLRRLFRQEYELAHSDKTVVVYARRQ